MNWKLVRVAVKGLNENEIIRFRCPVSSLNKTLSRVIKDRVFKRTVVVRTAYKPLFHDRYVWAHRAKHRAYKVCSRRRTQSAWEEHRADRRHAQVFYEEAE